MEEQNWSRSKEMKLHLEARFLNVACVVVILKLFKFNALFYRIPFLNLEYVMMMFLVFVPFLFTLLHMRH